MLAGLGLGIATLAGCSPAPFLVEEASPPLLGFGSGIDASATAAVEAAAGGFSGEVPATMTVFFMRTGLSLALSLGGFGGLGLGLGLEG